MSDETVTGVSLVSGALVEGVAQDLELFDELGALLPVLGPVDALLEDLAGSGLLDPVANLVADLAPQLDMLVGPLLDALP